MELKELELVSDSKVLMKGKVVFDGFLETRVKLIDGKFGHWAVFGTDIKNAEEKWVKGCFTIKGDAYNLAADEVVNAYRQLASDKAEDVAAGVGDSKGLPEVLDTIEPPNQEFTADDIPF